jgi:hypothetical protein
MLHFAQARYSEVKRGIARLISAKPNSMPLAQIRQQDQAGLLTMDEKIRTMDTMERKQLWQLLATH